MQSQPLAEKAYIKSRNAIAITTAIPAFSQWDDLFCSCIIPAHLSCLQNCHTPAIEKIHLLPNRANQGAEQTFSVDDFGINCDTIATLLLYPASNKNGQMSKRVKRMWCLAMRSIVSCRKPIHRSCSFFLMMTTVCNLTQKNTGS